MRLGVPFTHNSTPQKWAEGIKTCRCCVFVCIASLKGCMLLVTLTSSAFPRAVWELRSYLFPFSMLSHWTAKINTVYSPENGWESRISYAAHCPKKKAETYSFPSTCPFSVCMCVCVLPLFLPITITGEVLKMPPPSFECSVRWRRHKFWQQESVQTHHTWSRVQRGGGGGVVITLQLAHWAL